MSLSILLSLIQTMFFAQPATLNMPAESLFAANASSTALQAQYFEARIDDKAFKPDEFWANAGNGVIAIQANDINDAGFQLMLPAGIKKGKHALNFENAHLIQCLYSTGDDAGEAMQGELHITLHDAQAGRIEAELNFDGELGEGEKFSVTAGRFALTYK